MVPALPCSNHVLGGARTRAERSTLATFSEHVRLDRRRARTPAYVTRHGDRDGTQLMSTKNPNFRHDSLASRKLQNESYFC